MSPTIVCCHSFIKLVGNSYDPVVGKTKNRRSLVFLLTTSNLKKSYRSLRPTKASIKQNGDQTSFVCTLCAIGKKLLKKNTLKIEKRARAKAELARPGQMENHGKSYGGVASPAVGKEHRGQSSAKNARKELKILGDLLAQQHRL